MLRLFLFLEAALIAILEFGIWDHDALSIVMGVLVVALTWWLRDDIMDVVPVRCEARSPNGHRCSRLHDHPGSHSGRRQRR